MKTIIFFIILAILFSQPVLSAISGDAKVEGIVRGYNKKTVTLFQEGKKVTVPLKAIPSSFKIKKGEKVQAVISKNTKIEGVVQDYNEETVTLFQKGHETKVPRKTIPSHFKIEVGERVHAIFDGKRVMEDIKKLHEKPQPQ